MRSLLLFLFFCALVDLSAQSSVVYEPVESTVYELLLELNGIGAIDFDPSILPLSRHRIAALLGGIDEPSLQSLSKRQSEEVTFYLKDFAFEAKGQDDVLYSYRNAKDSLFHFGISPYFSGTLTSNGSETMIERGVGLNAFGYLGDHLAVYGRLRDAGSSKDLMAANFLSDRRGGNLKPDQEFFGQESFDYSELNGGITYSWDWGHAGLVKERMEWGMNQYGANILSGLNPSNVMIDLQLSPAEWFEFKYVHAWLVSEVLDSSRTYLIPGGQRQVFTNKNMAANMFGFKIKKGLRVDVGNSIIYSDNGIEPIYLIPLFFFKSADHNNNGAGSNQLGQNAQVFASASYAGWKGLWVYSTLFIDEVNIGKITDESAHTNLYSFKLGGRWNAAAVFDNVDISLKGEYTRTNPWTYRHQIPSTTFASNDYTLGHYLGENSAEWVLGVECRPLRGLKIAIDHRHASTGAPHVYDIINGNANVTGLDHLSPAIWERDLTTLSAAYELLHQIRVEGRFSKSSVSGQSGLLHPFEDGEQTLLEFGFSAGF